MPHQEMALGLLFKFLETGMREAQNPHSDSKKCTKHNKLPYLTVGFTNMYRRQKPNSMQLTTYRELERCKNKPVPLGI